MGFMTAASFLTLIDNMLTKDRVTKTQYNILMRDMPELLDILNKAGNINDDKDMVISLLGNVDSLMISNPLYRRYYDKERISSEEWFSGPAGHYYRPDVDKPVAKFYHNNGVLERELWRKEGMLHRDGDKPATITYYPNGKVETLRWAVKKDIHRDGDKPAVVAYFENGKLSREEWHQRGPFHRGGDKPAVIKYYDNGQIRSEKWFTNGSLFRGNNKPVKLCYDRNGNLTDERCRE